MAQRVLELTLVSASNLKDVNFFRDMEVYAVAFVSIYGEPRNRQRTETDREGGTDPAWDETLWFTVPPTAAAASASVAYLHVLLRTERFFGDDRDVGEVFIPLADLLAGACAGATPPRCASYVVRKVQCTRLHGMLNFSYRLGPVMAPLLRRDTGCWDTTPFRPPPPWDYYPPTGVRMPAAPRHAGGGATATLAGTKNIRNSSFGMGFGAELLRGGFDRMLFGDMPSSHKAAHKSG